MTKQEILDKFSDIDFVYNDSSKHDTLSRMLDELMKQSDERYFNMVISWFREMITFYEFHLQHQSNRPTTFIEAFKDVHDFAYDSLRDYFKQKGGERNDKRSGYFSCDNHCICVFPLACLRNPITITKDRQD